MARALAAEAAASVAFVVAVEAEALEEVALLAALVALVAAFEALVEALEALVEALLALVAALVA